MDKTLNTGLQAWRGLGGGLFALIVSGVKTLHMSLQIGVGESMLPETFIS